LVQEVAAAAKALLPERLADNRNLLLSRRVLVGTEAAAERGWDAEHVEEAGADGRPLQPDRLTAPGQRQVALAIGGGRLDRAALVPRVVEVRRRHRRRLPFPGLRDRDQALRPPERKRPQKHRVDHAEHRRRAADPDGERDESDEGEVPAAGQPPERVEDVLAERVHAFSSLTPDRVLAPCQGAGAKDV
jgi:hypothetical protein